jgi:hypothetical protein
MASSWMLRRMALVRTDVSEELSASYIRVTRIGELGTTLAVTSTVPSSPILATLMNEALSCSETSVLTRATRRNIPEDAIPHKLVLFLVAGVTRVDTLSFGVSRDVGAFLAAPIFRPQRPGLEPRSGLMGFVMEKEVLGQVLFEYFGSPCQFSSYQLLHAHNRPSSGASTEWTQSGPTLQKRK